MTLLFVHAKVVITCSKLQVGYHLSPVEHYATNKLTLKGVMFVFALIK